MIREEAYQMAVALIEPANPRRGALMVIGCSTSEVTGNKIGTASVPEVAEELYQGIAQAAAEHGIFVAAQCCEHLNRALILEREAAEARFYEAVNVKPQPKAGGRRLTSFGRNRFSLK